MRRVKRTAITVKPRQPYIEWANALGGEGIELGDEYAPELTVYLVEDIADSLLDIGAIIAPHYEAIFEEELATWHRRASDWPQQRDLATFLAWFEVEVHSIVLDLAGGWLCKERYEGDRF